jgi:hypothetical protein
MEPIKQPTILQHLELIEKAIDLGQAKGAYNKLDVVNIVNSLHSLYKYVEQHESKATSFKGVPQENFGSATDPK